ncbi:complement factor H-like [Betta splendens]|uniref:Complement factor H-like n=1 Tax=Betta splendens TaxID=158456 RepID=A0A9W2XDA4_BETSP|nr:complement factor H-like [Betta splendens]
MRDRRPGSVLLLWFPAVLLVSAQTAERPCQPVVKGVFVIPPEDKYDHNQTVSYSCDNGLKPAVKGWWAQITCLNGQWSPEPQCIDENSCVQPDNVPNTIYSSSPTGWYENGKKIQVRCDKGYGTKSNLLTGTCINGTWSSMPVCEKRTDSCSEPPQLPHAVIINQTQQEVFAADSEVMYQCEDGYTTEQGESRKSVFCISGNWTKGPTCIKPDSSPMTMPVSHCGNLPHIPHSAVLPGRITLTYSCAGNYKLIGPKTVVCYNDGTWSETPTCEAEGHCVLDPAQYNRGTFNRDYQAQNVPEGETRYLYCYRDSHIRGVRCSNGILTVARYCCLSQDRDNENCW